MAELVFHKVINSTIFTTDFSTFVSNNTIDFNEKGIAVVYVIFVFVKDLN